MAVTMNDVWKPEQNQPEGADHCASPANEYQHAWSELSNDIGWCALCGVVGHRTTAPWNKGFRGASTPAIYRALAEALNDE